MTSSDSQYEQPAVELNQPGNSSEEEQDDNQDEDSDSEYADEFKDFDVCCLQTCMSKISRVRV